MPEKIIYKEYSGVGVCSVGFSCWTVDLDGSLAEGLLDWEVSKESADETSQSEVFRCLAFQMYTSNLQMLSDLQSQFAEELKS